MTALDAAGLGFALCVALPAVVVVFTLVATGVVFAISMLGSRND